MAMNNEEKKKNDSFINGITLIIIGVVALMVTFFDFELDWHVLAQLWPLLLIIIGVCIMPINKWIRTVLLLALVAAGLIAYHNKTENVTKVINKTEIKSVFSGDDDDDY
ncbi:MAG: hypothetical protein CW336_08545 [Bacteroidetes bacterium]|jgi:general stress protein CsbA|nr:hypothetical protein [Bacteroidota bacterium]